MSKSTGAAVSIRRLNHGYVGASGEVPVLHGVDLELEAGAYAAISGPSGAGKSTLLGLIGGLEKPRSGSIVVAGSELADLAGDALAGFRRATLGFVFQHFGLLSEFTALENVELALALAGVSTNARRNAALSLLERAGLAARAYHRPSALSGGERQRVAIVRAMANRPRLLLADEPTGNLDPAAARSVIQMLEALRAETGCTLIVVTHNAELAGRAEQVLRLESGRVRAA
ncbi:MAG: ABC transporter ATP-binding protein [Candidatus Dormibacteraeota bacterium]|nr:ABC transporter ATP-binding protein [Candidatus Dormibacteraeota bacterium]